jgi:prepilin-type processing-associated H-X9-DG protein
VDGKIGGNSYIYSSDSASPWSQVDEDINLAAPSKTAKVSFRHSSAMNAVYADGHVGTITWADRKDTNRLSETIWRGRTP